MKVRPKPTKRWQDRYGWVTESGTRKPHKLYRTEHNRADRTLHDQSFNNGRDIKRFKVDPSKY